MKFICVLSIGGSLASYEVEDQNSSTYKATLRPVNGDRTDLPQSLLLEKTDGRWQATPPHEELVKSLVYAIESHR